MLREIRHKAYLIETIAYHVVLEKLRLKPFTKESEKAFKRMVNKDETLISQYEFLNEE